GGPAGAGRGRLLRLPAGRRGARARGDRPVRPPGLRRAACILAPVLRAAGCAGVQSALEPAGVEAVHIDRLLRLVTLFLALVFAGVRSEEHTSELQSRENLVCRLLLEKKKKQ